MRTYYVISHGRRFVVFASIFKFLARRYWGRSLLLKYPGFFSYGIFSHAGPSEQQIAESSFEMVNIAKGYSHCPPSAEPESENKSVEKGPDARIVTRVRGPEPGYIACSIFVVAAARVLLEERENIGVSPGVWTPGYLFHATTYVDRLKARGIDFEVLSSSEQ